MSNLKFFLLLAATLWISSKVHSQIPFDSLFNHPARIISPLPGEITDIEADEEGNLYLLESGRHKIHKLFARRNYDSLLTVGGKGTGEEGFNLPAKICAPNRQNLYVLDQMNRRIAVLNTNLRVVADINFLDIDLNRLDEDQQYLNPLSFTAGSSGDLYFLNQENLKVYRINSYGQVQTVFGGFDYGDGSLLTPDDLTINQENFIFVADTAHQSISVFDLFGVFQYKMAPTAEFRWKRITSYGNYLICFGQNHLLFINELTKMTHEVKLLPQQILTDVAGIRDKIFLLTSRGIEIYIIGK